MLVFGLLDPMAVLVPRLATGVALACAIGCGDAPAEEGDDRADDLNGSCSVDAPLWEVICTAGPGRDVGLVAAQPAPDGTTIVAGFYEGELACLGEQLKARSERDVLVAKLDKNGAPVWVRTLRSFHAKPNATDLEGNPINQGFMTVSDLSVSDDGSVSISGTFSGVPLEPDFPIVRLAPRSEGEDGLDVGHAFVASWSFEGDPRFLLSFGGGPFDEASAPDLVSGTKNLRSFARLFGTVHIDGQTVSAKPGAVFGLEVDPKTGSVLRHFAFGAGAQLTLTDAIGDGDTVTLLGKFSDIFQWSPNEEPLDPRSDHDLYVCRVSFEHGTADWCAQLGAAEAFDERSFDLARGLDGGVAVTWFTDAAQIRLPPDNHLEDFPSGGYVTRIDREGKVVSSHNFKFMLASSIAIDPKSGDALLVGDDGPFGVDGPGAEILEGDFNFFARLSPTGEVLRAVGTDEGDLNVSYGRLVLDAKDLAIATGSKVDRESAHPRDTAVARKFCP